MDLLVLTENVLETNRKYLQKISNAVYTEKNSILNEQSIGYHTRHVLEHLLCLLDQNSSGVINYDLRRRNAIIEEDTTQALEIIDQLLHDLPTVTFDNDLMIEVSFADNPDDYFYVKSSFERELIYNLEHTIHHNSLIMQVLNEKDSAVSMPDAFDVKPLIRRHHQLLGEE
jgi:hypothetical protein